MVLVKVRADILVFAISKSGTLFNFGNSVTGFCKIEYSKCTENRKPYCELETLYGIEPLKGRMYYQSKTAINIIEEQCDRILRSNNIIKDKDL